MRFTHPAALLAAYGKMEETTIHYKPLNGRSLREIALNREHHGNGRFINPVGLPRNGRFWQLMKWKISQNRFRPYLKDQPRRPVAVDWEPVLKHRGAGVTFLKHACILVKDVDSYLLVDPVISDIFWFIEDFSPLTFNPRQIPKPDHVLVTHGHYDHLDTSSLAFFEKNTHVISPLGYDFVFKDLGMLNRTRLDWYDTHRNGGRSITFLPTNHWTLRNPLRGPNRSLWGGYMIETAAGRTIYLMGDSGYFDGFAEIGRDYDIDLAIISLGAYEPRWFMASSHMNPKEAVKAFKELDAKKLMIIHWGTFRLGDEPVHFPLAAIKKELKKEGLLDRLVDIQHGETYFMN
ncbi:MAG: MBL fold metallo-hydrolase [Proteobacteria bacterium]|nr:MBL fold metallo-hydrolase [Pseudomonadota bacterium]